MARLWILYAMIRRVIASLGRNKPVTQKPLLGLPLWRKESPTQKRPILYRIDTTLSRRRLLASVFFFGIALKYL